MKGTKTAKLQQREQRVSELTQSSVRRCSDLLRVAVYRCEHGYLSGARCRLAYGPADATATYCLLLDWKDRMTSEVNSPCIVALMSALCCVCVATETETADTSGRVTTANISPAFTFSEYNIIIRGTRVISQTAESEARARRLYILCWREHSRCKLYRRR